MNSLATIRCPKCGSNMGEVINAEANTRKGWWCQECNHWITTVGREKLLDATVPLQGIHKLIPWD